MIERSSFAALSLPASLEGMHLMQTYQFSYKSELFASFDDTSIKYSLTDSDNSRCGQSYQLLPGIGNGGIIDPELIVNSDGSIQIDNLSQIPDTDNSEEAQLVRLTF